MSQFFASRVAKVLELQFSISPSNEYSVLISFRIDWFDPLAVQGTLKSLLQHHSSKEAIPYSALSMVQLSHLYMTTGKIIAFLLCANNSVASRHNSFGKDRSTAGIPLSRVPKAFGVVCYFVLEVNCVA